MPSKLPEIPEMGLELWKASLPPPQTIYLCERRLLGNIIPWHAKVYFGGNTNDAIYPPFQIISYESRRYFTDTARYKCFGFGIATPIYMNGNKDTVWLWSIKDPEKYIPFAAITNHWNDGKFKRPIEKRVGHGNVEIVGITWSTLYGPDPENEAPSGGISNPGLLGLENMLNHFVELEEGPGIYHRACRRRI